jgi:hypothetical protein
MITDASASCKQMPYGGRRRLVSPVEEAARDETEQTELGTQQCERWEMSVRKKPQLEEAYLFNGR